MEENTKQELNIENASDQKPDIDGINQDNSEREAWILTYSIFDYLKQHPSLVIAIVSGLAALYTLCSNIADYIRKVSFFSYWNIPEGLYIPNEKSILLVFGGSLFSVVMGILFFFLMFDTYRTYFSNIQIVRYSRIQDSEIKRLQKRGKHQLNKLERLNNKRKRMLKQGSSRGIIFDKEFVDDIGDVEKIIQEERERYIKEAEKRKQEQLDSKALDNEIKAISYRRQVIKKEILYAFLLFIVMTLSSQDLSLASLVLHIILVLMFESLSFFMGRRLSENYKSRKEVLRAEKTERYRDIFRQGLKRGFIDSIFSDGIRKAFPNVMFVAMSMMIALTLIINTFGIGLLQRVGDRNRTEMRITSLDNDLYAVIYCSESSMYLERAEINDDELIVNTNSFIVIPLEKVEIEHHRFTKIVQLKE